MRVTIADFRKLIDAIPHEHDHREVVHLDYEYGYSLPTIFQRKSDNPKDDDMYVIGGGSSRAA